MDVMSLYRNFPTSGRIKNKGGGEYCGPCPSCGGDDRFVLWPKHPSGAIGGRFMCRSCGIKGDAADFLQIFHGMTYREACKALGIQPVRNDGSVMARSPSRGKWTLKPGVFPSVGWMRQAARFVSDCASGVDFGPAHDALASRGLTVETAHALGIGWHDAERNDRRTDWGLPEEIDPESGRPRKVRIPRGLVLPIRRKAGIVALLVRRADWTPGGALPKYQPVEGSGCFSFCVGKAGLPVVVLKSILDAALVWQEAGDVAAAVALDGVDERQDADVAGYLRGNPSVLWSLDCGDADRDARSWRRERFFHAMSWPVFAGKDLREMVKAGISVRTWVNAGIEARLKEKFLPSPGVLGKLMKAADEDVEIEESRGEAEAVVSPAGRAVMEAVLEAWAASDKKPFVLVHSEMVKPVNEKLSCPIDARAIVDVAEKLGLPLVYRGSKRGRLITSEIVDLFKTRMGLGNPR